MPQVGIFGGDMERVGIRPEFDQVTIRNYADVDMAPALLIRPGLTADQRGYHHWQSWQGTTRFQMGKNATNDFILYDTQADNHILYCPSGSEVYISADGTHAVRINGYAGSGTGGFEVYSGGPVPAKVLRIMSSIQVFANNAAALLGGLVAGDVYRTGGDPDLLCIVH